MEKRKIMIANTKTNQRYTIETDATTLGELQDALSAQGIDYSGMDFTEGISKTHLISRESLLPTNVMYKGQPTNDLVMLLTNTTKKIESGVERDRKTAYEIIKNNNMAGYVKNHYGRNYTNLSTKDLWTIIDKLEITRAHASESMSMPAHEVQQAPCHSDSNVEATNSVLVNAIYDNIKMLATSRIITANDMQVIASLVSELAARTKEENQVNITESDINAMIAEL
jgi:hypothetical protein